MPITLRRITGLIAIALVATACGPSDEGGAATDEVTVLAKADGWRDGLQEASGHAYAVIEIADGGSAEQAWNENVPPELPDINGDPDQPGIYRHLDDVDLEQQRLVVYSSGESSSCPGWVEDISSTDGRVDVELHVPAAEACTDDFQPYRLVLAVPRDALPGLEDLPMDRVDVSSANLTDVDAQVVAYPLEP